MLRYIYIVFAIATSITNQAVQESLATCSIMLRDAQKEDLRIRSEAHLLNFDLHVKTNKQENDGTYKTQVTRFHLL